MPTMRADSRAGDAGSQQFLRALEELPPARRGPVLRAGRRATVVWPDTSRRVQRPEPLMDRLLAGELHRRLVLVLAGALIFLVLITALGSSFFV